MDRLVVCISSPYPNEDLSGQWYLFAQGGKGGKGGKGGSKSDSGVITGVEELRLALQTYPQAEVRLYLPGEACPTYWVHLPKKSREAIKSIPYQIEPLITEPLDDVSFFPLLKVTGQADHYAVWVCNSRWLQRWMHFLQESNLHIDLLRPDYSLLWEYNPNGFYSEPQSAQLGERCLLSGTLNASGPTEFIKTVLETSTESAPVDIDLSVPPEWQGKWIDSLVPQQKKKQAGDIKMQKMFAIAACLLTTVMIINVAFGFVEQRRLQQQITAQSERIDQMFKQVLPDARKVDPNFQLQQALLQRKQAAQPSALLQGLNLLGQQIGGNATGTIRSFRYSNREQLLTLIHSGNKIESFEPENGMRLQQTQQGEEHHVSLAW